MPDGRVLIAPSDGPLVASPTWERFDELSTSRCSGIDIVTGRDSEFDAVETGTARVYFKDRDQTMNDPALVGCQIQLQMYDPFQDLWVPQYRGIIDEPDFDVAPSGVKADVTLNCVDVMDYLAGIGFTLDGSFGDAGATTDVVTYAISDVQGRIEQILGEAGIDPTRYSVFTGNVNVGDPVHGTRYDADESILTAIRDASDAEFPGVGLLYVDKAGRIVWHGRFARLDPEGTAVSTDWDFQSWTAGDGAAVNIDPTTVAQIRTFAFNYPRSRIINSYQAWQKSYTAEPDIQAATDATSISTYGFKGRSAPNLIIDSNFNNSNTAAQECQLFCDYYVSNYKDAARNVRSVTFKSVDPADERAEGTWPLLSGIEISDRLTLTVADAGAAAEAYFVEGLSIQIRPLNPDFDYVEVTPNLSPEAYFTDDVFAA